MIVLVGPDRCGKTTLAGELRNVLPDHSYVHNTKPPMSSFEYFGRVLQSAHPNMIMDRCHWCEWVYGHTYRHGSDLTVQQFLVLDLFMLSLGAYVIYMHDELSNIVSRWDGKEMFNSDGVGELLRLYDGMYDKSRLPKYKGTLPEFLKPKGIWRHVDMENVNKKQYISPSVGYGGRGGYMIVGDTSNPNAIPSGGVIAPFAYGKSSLLMWDCLMSYNIDPYKGFFINSSSLTDPQFCEDVMYGVKPERVIALGNNAGSVLSSNNIEYSKIPHPSYALRNGSEQDWGARLQDELREYML